MMVACVEMDGTGSTGCTRGIQKKRPLDVSIADKEPLKKHVQCHLSHLPSGYLT